jgi:hypothetical protein
MWHDNSLARKWLAALNHVIQQNLHLEKNYCFLGWAEGDRNGAYLIEQINSSITAINAADTGYHINDHFTLNTVLDGDRAYVTTDSIGCTDTLKTCRAQHM